MTIAHICPKVPVLQSAFTQEQQSRKYNKSTCNITIAFHSYSHSSWTSSDPCPPIRHSASKARLEPTGFFCTIWSSSPGHLRLHPSRWQKRKNTHATGPPQLAAVFLVKRPEGGVSPGVCALFPLPFLTTSFPAFLSLSLQNDSPRVILLLTREKKIKSAF